MGIKFIYIYVLFLFIKFILFRLFIMMCRRVIVFVFVCNCIFVNKIILDDLVDFCVMYILLVWFYIIVKFSFFF